MSFIPCTSNCTYQKDGVCTLENTFYNGPSFDSGCIHYVPKPHDKYNADGIKNNIDEL